MKRQDTILDDFFKNQESFKKNTDDRIENLLNRYFSLEDFGKFSLTREDWEQNARRGDPFSLVMLGKFYYDTGNEFDKRIAFDYFRAATQKKKTYPYLANAIASYVKEPVVKRKYYRLSIEYMNGDRVAVKGLSRMKKHGYFHSIMGKGGYGGRNWQSTKEEFLKFSQSSPDEFRELCLEYPYKTLESILGNDSAQVYFEKFQNTLAEKVLAAERQRQESGQVSEKAGILKEFSEKYHSAYLKGLDPVIEKRKEYIENQSGDVLHKIEGLAITATKELLASLRVFLKNEQEESEKNKEELTSQESQLLSQVLALREDESTLEGQDHSLLDLIKSDPSARSIYLQLQAFNQVATVIKEGLPPPVSPESLDPSQKEYHQTNKLQTVAETIQNTHGKLSREIKGSVQAWHWSEFVKIALAACTVVGVALMINSQVQSGTHKFWNRDQQLKSKSEKIKKESALKAKRSFHKTFDQQVSRMHTTLPELKHPKKTRRS